MVPGPCLVGLHRGGQGGEETFRADLAGQAEGLQPVQQVLFDPGEREHGPGSAEFWAERFYRLQAVKSTR